MSEKYKFHDPEGIYFVTLTIVGWIDLFTRPDYKYMIVESIKYCQKEKGLIVHAWCIMSSHVHLIISKRGEPGLSEILRDIKKYTSKKTIELLEVINESRKEWLLKAFELAADKIKRNSKYKVWQDGNHPVLLDTNEMMQQRLDYIHNNPVEAGIVDEPEYYVFSSARDYAGRKGLLDVEFID
ncbi:MAG: transposase [Cyclobacteriaceae bacterium]|nr:transposase [Cyclobacteriaceae bacterium]